MTAANVRVRPSASRYYPSAPGGSGWIYPGVVRRMEPAAQRLAVRGDAEAASMDHHIMVKPTQAGEVRGVVVVAVAPVLNVKRL